MLIQSLMIMTTYSQERDKIRAMPIVTLSAAAGGGDPAEPEHAAAAARPAAVRRGDPPPRRPGHAHHRGRAPRGGPAPQVTQSYLAGVLLTTLPPQHHRVYGVHVGGAAGRVLHLAGDGDAGHGAGAETPPALAAPPRSRARAAAVRPRRGHGVGRGGAGQLAAVVMMLSTV